MAMLIGVRRWADGLKPGWDDLMEQGTLIHSGDPGIKGRGEGRGGLAAGNEGLSWVLVGALGGLVSKRVARAMWSALTDFSLDEESKSLHFGYESRGKRGRVSFIADLDPYSMGPRGGPRHRFEGLARVHLPAEGWGYNSASGGWGWSRHTVKQR
jgi:hypothetical protein